MSTFLIHTLTPSGESGPTLRYDNQTSALTDLKTGEPVVKSFAAIQPECQDFATSRDNPATKVSPRVLKISLGLSCNYECEYCSQRFVWLTSTILTARRQLSWPVEAGDEFNPLLA